MDNQSVIDRIKFLISELRMKQNSFANRIGTDVSNLSKHLNGKLPISDALVNKIVVNLGVSKVWLTTGAGVPFPRVQDDRIVGRINVPGISQESRIVKVSGDSMRPVINEGDYIAVHEIRDMSVIYWGQIYVVVLDDYRMVKYLRRHPKNGMVILRSENKMYDDIELPCDAIRKLFFVDNIIHIDTRM